MKIQSGKITLITVSLFTSVFICEMILAKFNPQKTFNAAYTIANKCFKKSNFAIFELKPNCTMNLRVFDSEKNVFTRLNSSGYRGNEFEIEKKPDEKRILIEGDSFVIGWGVEDEKTLVKVLDDKLGFEWNVINAGYAGGLGPDGYFLHIKNEGIKLSPDLVVFSVFVYNDFSDMKDNEWIGLGKYGEPDRVASKILEVQDKGILLPKNMPFVYKIPVLKNSHFAVLLYNGYKKIERKMVGLSLRNDFNKSSISECVFSGRCDRQDFDPFDDLMSVVKASRDIAESQFDDGKTHFLVMIIPADFQINPNLTEKYKLDLGVPKNASQIKNSDPQRRLIEMMEKEGIEYLDLLPIFRLKEKNLYFETDGHWNEEGHKAAGEAMYNWIIKNYGASKS